MLFLVSVFHFEKQLHLLNQLLILMGQLFYCRRVFLLKCFNLLVASHSIGLELLLLCFTCLFLIKLPQSFEVANLDIQIVYLFLGLYCLEFMFLYLG